VPSPGVPEYQRRMVWFVVVVACAFLVLLGRLWQLQVVRGEQYFQRSTDNFVKEQWIPAVRGRILDRRGEVLVDNRPAFHVYVTPRYYSPEAEANLVRLLGLGESEALALRAKVTAQTSLRRYRSVLVFEDIDRDRLALIEQARADLPGVSVGDAPHRNYHAGTLAAHVIGYMNQISDAELDERRKDGYDETDAIGRYGIEKQWENFLRGKKGVERYVVDAKGQRKTDKEAEELISGERFVPPVPGHAVVLTLDARLQRIAERALRNHPAGGIAVVETGSGKILALVSKPAFDPNVMTGHLTRAEEAQMEADPHKPFLDKTLRQHYYPGSTYKFVTAIAALEEGGVSPDDRVTCRGWHELGRHTFRCTKAHGSVALYEAIAQSCNVYFWHLAEKVGIDRIAKVARDFGFGAPTGLGLNGDVPGRVPWKAWYESAGGFRIGYTLNTAIGQGDTEVTVLQLALSYAALANGGTLWVPQIVLRVETAEGVVVADYAPVVRRKVAASARTLELVRSGLLGVVNDPRGTAFEARLDEVQVAGKTGTAQVRKLQKQPTAGWHPYRDHAWFAGYAPADRPEIAIVVLVEHGGKGGHVAAPVAMEIVHGYFQDRGDVAPHAAGVTTAPEEPSEEVEEPFLLEDSGDEGETSSPDATPAEGMAP
jgi:penicillin-binding protein 2